MRHGSTTWSLAQSESKPSASARRANSTSVSRLAAGPYTGRWQPKRISLRPPTVAPGTRSDTDSSRNASLSGHPRWHRARAPIQTAAETHLSQATHGGSGQALRYRQQPKRISLRPPTVAPGTRSDTDSSRSASLSGHPRWRRARAPIQTAAEAHLSQATHGGAGHALRYRQQPKRISLRPPTVAPGTRSDTDSSRSASLS